MTSRWFPTCMAVALALLVASGCKDAEHAPAEQPAPDAEPQPEASAQTQAPSNEPVPTLEEIRRLYDEAGGNRARLGPVKAKLDRFLAEHPDDPDALPLLAQVHLEQGRMDDSLATSERCVAIAAETAACWLTIGVVAEIKGAKDRAIESYRRYLELAPDGLSAPDVRKALERLGAQAPAPADASAKLETFGGSLDAAPVKAIIEERVDKLRSCYEAVLDTRPELAGKLTYTLRIHPTGHVVDVTVDDDTLGNAAVTTCTKAKIKGWRFPASDEELDVTFSVVFSSK